MRNVPAPLLLFAVLACGVPTLWTLRILLKGGPVVAAAVQLPYLALQVTLVVLVLRGNRVAYVLEALALGALTTRVSAIAFPEAVNFLLLGPTCLIALAWPSAVRFVWNSQSSAAAR
jgi:hypothetical protein